MFWSHYVINQIDFSWDCLLTVAETAERIAKQEARARLRDSFTAVTEIAAFIDLYDSAKAEAKEAGWCDDGVEPVVFWVPVEDDVSQGFAFRQADGKAFILSPLALPHLDAAPEEEG